MFRQRRQLVGLDLSDACANAVVVEAVEDSQELFIREYVMQAREENQPLEDLVADIYGKLRTRSKECALSAWPQGSVLRFAEDDANDPRQMRRRFLKEAEGAMDHHVLDCVQLETKRKGSMKSYLACGIPVEELKRFSNIFTRRGVEVRLLQLSPIAVFNAFQASHDDLVKESPYLLLDFAEHTTTIIAGRGSELQLIRIVEWGMAPLRNLLLDEGMLWPPTSISVLPEDEKEATETIKPLMAPLTREVQKSLDFLYQTEEGRADLEAADFTSGSGLETIYVSGRLSSMKIFVEELRTDLQMSCQQWNPCRKMIASKSALIDFRLLADLSRLPAAAGAAMQCLL